MDNHQDDNKDIKNEDDINTKKQHRYLRLDDDVRKKSFLYFGKILAFIQKHIYRLVSVLLVIVILIIGMTFLTYIKVTEYRMKQFDLALKFIDGMKIDIQRLQRVHHWTTYNPF